MPRYEKQISGEGPKPADQTLAMRIRIEEEDRLEMIDDIGMKSRPVSLIPKEAAYQ